MYETVEMLIEINGKRLLLTLIELTLAKLAKAATSQSGQSKSPQNLKRIVDICRQMIFIQLIMQIFQIPVECVFVPVNVYRLC